MINKNHEVYKHKHICLVEDHYNPLGIVRSLGEEGIKPIVLLCAKHPYLVNHSKYIGFDINRDFCNLSLTRIDNE